MNPSTDPTVTKGYQAIYQANADMMLTQIGQVELLLSLTGGAAGADTFGVQAALQHPFSMGELYIATPNPFDYPVINPNYFSHPAGASTFFLRLVHRLGRLGVSSLLTTPHI